MIWILQTCWQQQYKYIYLKRHLFKMLYCKRKYSSKNACSQYIYVVFCFSSLFPNDFRYFTMWLFTKTLPTVMSVFRMV